MTSATSGERSVCGVWQPIGADADVAWVALCNQEHDLEAIALGRVKPESATSSGPSGSAALDVAQQQLRRKNLLDGMPKREHVERIASLAPKFSPLAQDAMRRISDSITDEQKTAMEAFSSNHIDAWPRWLPFRNVGYF